VPVVHSAAPSSGDLQPRGFLILFHVRERTLTTLSPPFDQTSDVPLKRLTPRLQLFSLAARYLS